jgi:hypothetical protein
MRQLKTLFTLCVIFLLAACANTTTLKASKESLDGKKVIFVPTGAVKVEGLSNTIGSQFGLLGMLIENAATEGSRNQAASQVNSILGGGEAFAIAKKSIQANSRKLGNISQIESVPHTLASAEFTSWFNSDDRIDIKNTSQMQGDMAIDFGFQGLNINNYLAGTYAEGTLGVRV